MTSTLISRIQKEHERCKHGAGEAIQAAVACGALLIELHEQTKDGDWNEKLLAIGINRKTAWNYMRIAEKWDAKKHHLTDGIYLCNLLRESEFKLLPELQGGGNRLGKDELERRRQQDQLVFHFNRVEPALDEVLSFEEGNPLLSEDEQTVEKVERGAKRMLQWVKEARKEIIET